MTVHEFFTNSRMDGGHSFIRGFIRGWFVAEPQAGMSALEGEIDELAQRGQLYGLSPEEINIVEGKGSHA